MKISKVINLKILGATIFMLIGFFSLFFTSNTKVLAEDSLVKCGTITYLKGEAVDENNKDREGQIKNPCKFDDVLVLVDTVIDFILFKMVIPIAAIMFAYAGFELLTSGGETSKRQKAKKIFTDVAIGLIIAAAAFLIVNAVLSIVGYNGTTFFK